MNMKKHQTIRKLILQGTDGVIGTITDLTLFYLYYTFCSPGRTSAYKLDQLTREANHFVDEVNYQTIKKAIYNLTQQQIVTRSHNHSAIEIQITKLGKKRLASLLPTYQEHRPWDEHVYLISYDIPVKSNKKRALFREHLRRTGCAMLQASLWLTPYAPHGIIDEFIDRYNPGGTILVSKLGKDGAIGEESFSQLINRVYHLDELAKRYREFIKTYQSKPRHLSYSELALEYYGILKNDPQLPFPLLPKNFPADSAHKLFLSLTT
jgi:DNA-binding transcriptional regulator PaaX